MIGRLRGQLLEKRPPWLMLDVQGLGYEVEATMTVFYDLPEVGAEVTLYTHLVVREDAQLLFGFADRFERELFRALIKVNGVGPKMALAILSGIEASQLARCIQDHDVDTLVKVPGVGRKTAERLLVDMGDRLEKLEGAAPMTGAGARVPLDATPDARVDAIAALESLGYRNRDAQKAVSGINDAESLGSEELIRQALRQLAR
jgi:Holliday junction DNA helicase RuvA